MRIVYNGTCFNDRPSGANQRFYGIYKEVIKQMPNDEFIIFEAENSSLSKYFKNLNNVEFIKTTINTSNKITKNLSNITYWKDKINNLNGDIYEGFHLPNISNNSKKNIHTIHDIRGLEPNWSGYFERLKYKLVLNKLQKNVDEIITVSNTMKQNLNNHYPNLKVNVVYNGIDINSYTNIDDSYINLIKKKLKIYDKFILTIGHLESRKNYINLIKALKILNSSNENMNLIIVGNENNNYGKEVTSIINKLDLNRNVRILSNITNDEVKVLYKLCDLFVFPSLYEGFGIPILEAMIARTPMVLSDIPVFREITENSTLYFNPTDPHEIANAIKVTIDDKDNKQKIINYGQDRIQDFSFNKLAKEIKKLYLK